MNPADKTIQLLQQYIPIILREQQYFDKLVINIKTKYHFSVDEESLRKKLTKYLEASYRDDSVNMAQRLIHGHCLEGFEREEDWIWFGGREIGKLVHTSVEDTVDTR